MIDFDTYQELHPSNKYSLTMLGPSNEYFPPISTNEPNATEILVFPPLIPGFDLRRKKWCKSLLVLISYIALH